jgi:hypothetical protein
MPVVNAPFFARVSPFRRNASVPLANDSVRAAMTSDPPRYTDMLVLGAACLKGANKRHRSRMAAQSAGMVN